MSGPDDISRGSHARDDVATDPYLAVDLDGVQLIEASAGTGKTFTLATLVTRLVVERGLRAGQILAVTFTEAATQELRVRLRRRLTLAAGIARSITDGTATHAASDDAEAALTRHVIRRQLAHEDAASLHARLRRAVAEIDLAAVFTIHGFCARVLGEHALETAQAFDPPELVGSDRDLRDEVASDLWRAYGADPGDAERLLRLWSGPEALAGDLGALLRAPRLLPPRPDATPDPLPELQDAVEALRAAFQRHGEDARTRLDAALAAGVINGQKAKKPSYEKAWATLAEGMGTGTWSRDKGGHLDKLTPRHLQDCARSGRAHELPDSVLFDALAHWFDADDGRQHWLAQHSIDLLHRIRDDATRRLALIKRTRRVQTFDDLIDGVADALDGAHGDSLVARLRAQYAVALVDEFQDTDARQWAIFRRVFGGGDDKALFLIGDPKQAIYGFRGGDVHTYLAARSDAASAPPLAHNFRSRPGVLRALAALYRQAGDAAFVDERIRFHHVEPGAGQDDADFQRNGRNAPAVTVRVLPPPDDARRSATWSAPESRALAAAACVAEIHALLADARDGRASIDGQPLQPGDIAVLVRSHAEAARMQAALVAAGIAAVAAGKQSLFATEQAQELLALFAALLQPADEGRLRAALATVLLGVDGEGIARLDVDDDWRRECQAQALHWRERWQRHGPLALVTDLCARHAGRLLGLLDGERRLTNLLQLGELLQEADARALGLHGLVDWLRMRIAEADANDETQLLRLESDARRVQILTLHKSKGLEFPLVFLPFAGIGHKLSAPSRHCQVPDADGCVLHWKPGDAAASQRWHDAVAAWEHEQRAEDARLLYVGLTRAQHALWLADGALYNANDTALAPMLAHLPAHADIAIDARALADAPAPLPADVTGSVPAARQAQRVLSRDWWIHSFTQLTHAAAEAAPGVDASAHDAGRVPVDDGAAEDEPQPVLATDVDWRFTGSRFGNVLHAALEHVEFAAWCDWRNDGAPPGQDAVLRAALRAEGYGEVDLDDGVTLLTALVGHTLTAGLPEGVRLCALPDAARRAEMEFHFALQPTPVDALLATLHAHGVLRERHGFGTRRRLEGLMTGKIDLVYRLDNVGLDNGMHAGQYFVLDYKSNRLPAYDAAALEAAMAESEYTLQALLYTLALHRWLRFRLGDGYDYARDFGGVRYLFCRGLDATLEHSPGIHAHKPARALVDALDALFAGAAP